jgi:predicted transcriptional regulator of viral defense system
VRHRPSCSTFFRATPIFGRSEFADAVGRSPGDRAVTELLKYHLRAGSIRRIARGVFASVPTGAVDRFLGASRLRTGAVIAYQSALELHGCTTKRAEEVQLIASGEPGRVETVDFACRFISRPSHYSPREGVTTVERQGLTVNVTTLERTLVDLFDRYELAGGAEELFQSLDMVAQLSGAVDFDSLVASAGALDNAAAAGAVGYWLERERDRLAVPAAALGDLRSLAPRQSRYALGATPGHGRAATGWNVILPNSIIERYFDD